MSEDNPFGGDLAGPQQKNAGDDLAMGTQVDFSFLDYTQADDTFNDFPQFDSQAGATNAAVEDALRDLSLTDGLAGEAAAAGEDGGFDLPEWACAYCGMHDPASVVRCISTGKWFCNGRSVGTGTASCIVTHLVKGKLREVSLHKNSPLGETVLECYASGSRNVFALGYVPLKDENTVVLLARDTPASSPAIKDLNLDMAQWQPLIADRAFVDWLVRHPGPEQLRAARRLTADEATKLEELWRAGKATATVEDLLLIAPETEEDPLPVALRYEDATAYESLFAALIKLEADYDKRLARFKLSNYYGKF